MREEGEAVVYDVPNQARARDAARVPYYVQGEAKVRLLWACMDCWNVHSNGAISHIGRQRINEGLTPGRGGSGICGKERRVNAKVGWRAVSGVGTGLVGQRDWRVRL